MKYDDHKKLLMSKGLDESAARRLALRAWIRKRFAKQNGTPPDIPKQDRITTEGDSASRE